MKRTLSLILAALLLASSVISCGKTEPKETEASETKKVETNAPATDPVETKAPETDPAETEAPALAYDPSLITENGVAKAHIVLSETASADEKTAADELAYHIKLVSGGAEVAITNAAQEDSLPIIIATPDSLPELEALFPEDLTWLRDTGTAGEKNRFGPDGFAVRQKDGKLYIFGATHEGALNGVYDFIEDNMGVLWIKTADDGIIYDEMPTITATKADYREKSPFIVRYGFGSQLLDQRNKHDTEARIHGACHNVKWLLTTSPTYDPSITEYWDTDIDGNHLTASDSKQVNFWSTLTADTIADSVIAILDSYDDASRPMYYTVGMEDIYAPNVYPEMTEPFEYAPGQFIFPKDHAYLSTVYYTFINRVAKRVAEKYPDVGINTLGYQFSVNPPACELESNVSIWFCPYNEIYTQPSFKEAYEEALAGSNDNGPMEALYYEQWVENFPKNEIVIFDYYFCHYVGGWYERPIWYRIASDFRYYAETGCIGTYSCGAYNDTSNFIYTWTNYGRGSVDYNAFPYKFTYADAHAMNLLSQWIFYKMTWNPYEDVDALIKYFCDKVYGEASDEMQEYYKLLEYGWKEGDEATAAEFNARIKLHLDQMYYYMYFLDYNLDDGTFYPDAIREVLTRAYEAADDKAKEFIRRPYEIFKEDWSRFIWEG